MKIINASKLCMYCIFKFLKLYLAHNGKKLCHDLIFYASPVRYYICFGSFVSPFLSLSFFEFQMYGEVILFMEKKLFKEKNRKKMSGGACLSIQIEFCRYFFTLINTIICFERSIDTLNQFLP